MLLSVVFPRTCSLRTNNVRTSGPRTRALRSVSFHLFPLLLLQTLTKPPHPPGQVGKVLGERWKALSDKQRQPYEAKAAADKKRYEDEKAAYNVSPPVADTAAKAAKVARSVSP